MKCVFDKDYILREPAITQMIQRFSTDGEILVQGKRNLIKLFPLEGSMLNIKSFQIPNLVNRFAYKYLRKSKARRSYEFANVLLEKGIGTPQPIAYFENVNLLMRESYYVSEHLNVDLTFRELTTDFDYPEHEIILRQFVQFTFRLHEFGIEFLDHTPGNTLIKKVGEGQYQFYLVDLNRMAFHSAMDFKQRILNMSKLTRENSIISTMSDEYAKLYGTSYEKIYQALSTYSAEFQSRLSRKKQLKKKLLFWR